MLWVSGCRLEACIRKHLSILPESPGHMVFWEHMLGRPPAARPFIFS